MNRQMVDSILQICEYNRFSKGIFAWVGFKTKWIEYDNRQRAAGKTKWSFWKLYVYSLDGIMAFSTTPLALSSIIGLVFFLCSLLIILAMAAKYLIWVVRFTAGLFWSAYCCLLPIQLFCTGIVEQYVSGTYMEAKRRPIYLSRI